ncbi:flagellar biosynthetic protein FliQ [Amorphus orientalis]|uniref:Flagellar biosynthetic protein FliQ n=1 Tax=Amorphus orientalis TaxID=649198 RepID=A0AAE3VSX8_9HYPH|nr:flagellar biosynthetic protein FliQ [Amorphus orientalis]MDQ0317573.1 flagellar biosynthetic protein FliQ [Amorphus orientalis]
MSEVDAIDIVQQAIWTIIVASSPAVVSAMLIGILIALFQALTQVQEMTLTFIPKILTILAVSALTATFIGAQIFAFTDEVYGRIITGF